MSHFQRNRDNWNYKGLFKIFESSSLWSNRDNFTRETLRGDRILLGRIEVFEVRVIEF